jgi:hypothetical protein
LARQVELGQRATDQDLIRFQKSITANIRASVRTRHEILLRKLISFDPIFMDILGPSVIAESGLAKRIKELGESIAVLVNSINNEYLAKHGENLFSPTGMCQ